MNEKLCNDPNCRGCDYPRNPELQKKMDHRERLTTDLSYFTQCVLGRKIDPMDLEPIKPADIPYNIPAPANYPTKKGKKMSRYYDEYNDCYVDQPQSDTADARSYFKNRIAQISNEKGYALRKQFGLQDDEAPKTMEDLVKRIQDGKYSIPKEYEGKILYDPTRYIKWRDPAVKEDQAGYDAAEYTFEKEADKARDAVMSQPFDKVAETVQALETWTV